MYIFEILNLKQQCFKAKDYLINVTDMDNQNFKKVTD